MRSAEDGNTRSLLRSRGVVLQRIRVEWTKASRGASGAARRAAVPEAVTLPTEHTGPVLVHDLTAREEDDFSLSVPGKRASGPESPVLDAEHGRFTPIEWRLSDDGLVVDLHQDGSGAPRRPKTCAFVLSAGQWGRVYINERFAHERSWSYRQTVVNVGFGMPISPGAFTERAPDAVFDARAHLR